MSLHQPSRALRLLKQRYSDYFQSGHLPVHTSVCKASGTVSRGQRNKRPRGELWWNPKHQKQCARICKRINTPTITHKGHTHTLSSCWNTHLSGPWPAGRDGAYRYLPAIISLQL